MQYDLVIIGGGPGGYAAAVHAARHGMRVGLVEKDQLGGTCLHRGCVPTKAYLHATEAARSAAVFADLAAFDRQAMLARKNEIVGQLTEGLRGLMKANRITVYHGLGTLQNASAPFCVTITPAQGGEGASPDVSATPQALTADRVIIATGSQPSRLPVLGCDDPEVWTSDDILGDKGAEAFGSVVIVGGGVIGLEMACVYARLGLEVTIVEAEKSCLPMMDRELSRSAEALLKDLGVKLCTGARLEAVERSGGGFAVLVEKDGAKEHFACERVLLATGRRPFSEGALGEGVSLAMERGCLAVDERFQTNIPGVYAIGDVNGRMQLAHSAHAQGLAAVSQMLGKPAPIDTELVPSCVYTTPEIASVGLTQEEAKARGLEVVCGKALTTQNARALIEGLGRGFIKLVFDKETMTLLGAQLFCGRATDLLGELTLAISQGLTATQLLRPLRAHPTFYEAVTEAAQAALK